MPAYRFPLQEALSKLPGSGEPRFTEIFRHGSLVVEMYVPQDRDYQTPHTRDEVYVVMEGEGCFVNGDDRHPFAPGDVLFVPAGVAHRFEDFGEELTVWVFFYGPEGGEAAHVP